MILPTGYVIWRRTASFSRPIGAVFVALLTRHTVFLQAHPFTKTGVCKRHYCYPSPLRRLGPDRRARPLFLHSIERAIAENWLEAREKIAKFGCHVMQGARGCAKFPERGEDTCEINHIGCWLQQRSDWWPVIKAAILKGLSSVPQLAARLAKFLRKANASRVPPSALQLVRLLTTSDRLEPQGINSTLDRPVLRPDGCFLRIWVQSGIGEA